MIMRLAVAAFACIGLFGCSRGEPTGDLSNWIGCQIHGELDKSYPYLGRILEGSSDEGRINYLTDEAVTYAFSGSDEGVVDGVYLFAGSEEKYTVFDLRVGMMQSETEQWLFAHGYTTVGQLKSGELSAVKYTDEDLTHQFRVMYHDDHISQLCYETVHNELVTAYADVHWIQMLDRFQSYCNPYMPMVWNGSIASLVMKDGLFTLCLSAGTNDEMILEWAFDPNASGYVVKNDADDIWMVSVFYGRDRVKLSFRSLAAEDKTGLDGSAFYFRSAETSLLP